jgi:lysyl-tRNA synthetase class 2
VLTVDALSTVVAGKLFQDLCGVNKKYKLGLKNPTPAEIQAWADAAAATK